MADLTFSTTLLGQFLEDMEAYAEVNKTMVYTRLNCCGFHNKSTAVILMDVLHL